MHLHESAAHSWSVRRLEREINRVKNTGSETKELYSGIAAGTKARPKIVVKKSEDESKVIIGGLDDLKVNKIISLLENI